MKRLICIFFCLGCALLSIQSSANELVNDPAAYVALQKVEGVRQPVLPLDGTWQFRYSPKGKWASVEVPGELAMQGFAIEHDKPYLYRKSVAIPKDYQGKQILLRFDGVYSQARLFVNGTLVREHQGGFTRWDTNVTSFVKAGKTNLIEVEITDRLDEISYASGYAHHPIGGILRSVKLLAQPESFLTDFYVETQLDSMYQDAVLKVGYTPSATDGEVVFTLTDPQGKPIQLAKNTFPLKQQLCQMEITNPVKWDAEHPNLYELAVSVVKNGAEVSHFSRKIGFRDIKIVKDRMLVNGLPVKLRGACRHDIHPTLGRTTTAELDSLDALRFKESNMNFVRTSHYPPSEKFLEYCDQMGLYVECETGVCFVETHRQKNYAPGATQSNPEFTDRYLSQCQEMVNTFRSHASILFWSIGNESVYGDNFQKCWDWVKATDTTRPVIFSYPGSVEKKEKIYDILSMHYQDVNGNLNQWGMHTTGFQGHGIPALYDEWAHPACYTYKTLQDDPNIREFWGLSLDKMWSGLFDAPGGLGGAIWGYIDEIFMLPQPTQGKAFWKEFARTAKPEEYQGECVGYGEWGIVDIWRRPKPEFWSTKKAYSPVKLLTTQTHGFASGERLMLPVYNRFDHTNLNELQVRYTYRGVAKNITMLSLLPHQKGLLLIPAEDWKEGEQVLIEFLTQSDELIDAELVTLGDETVDMPAPSLASSPLSVEETSGQLIVKGSDFVIPFDKATGLIQQATSKGEVLIQQGPFLHLDINLNHLTGAEVRKSANKYETFDADWMKKAFSYKKESDAVHVSISGLYKEVELDMHVVIRTNGRMDINYVVKGEPNGYLRETGLSFYLPETIQFLNWKRDGHWSYYPENDFAGNTGNTSLFDSRQAAYGKQPVQPWAQDTHNYYYWADAGANCSQPLTQMAKGMKENIYHYTLSSKADNPGFSVLSPDASLACRMNKGADGQLFLYINNQWDYPEIAWGNYCKTLEVTPCYGQITIQF